jgi:hypothetical protein
MSELRFSCPHCGQHIAGSEEYVGATLDCPNCQQSFTLTDPRRSTSLRLTSHLEIAPPGAGAHSAPIAPEAQARLDADMASLNARAQLSKTARLTQFLGRLIHHKPADDK